MRKTTSTVPAGSVLGLFFSTHTIVILCRFLATFYGSSFIVLVQRLPKRLSVTTMASSCAVVSDSGHEQPRTTSGLEYVRYEHRLEKQYLPAIRALISKDLSEPYSIYVYRYFLYQWSHLCFMVLWSLAARNTRTIRDFSAVVINTSRLFLGP